MGYSQSRGLGTLLLCYLLIASAAKATEPPQNSGRRSIDDRLRNFTTKRGYVNLVSRLATNREQLRKGRLNFFAAQASGGLQVRGTRAIPVLPLRYGNTGQDPYPVTDLQRELFNGPWPTGTMSEYYRQVSYGTFTVTGTVQPWQTLAHDDRYYEGPDTEQTPCNGICGGGKMAELLREAFSLNDAAVDFRMYDNDGPDNTPNSGDDDGYVDFVAIVQPEFGGECNIDGEVNRNIWSHRFSYSDLTGGDYVTGDVGANGLPIRIDDYVLTPALACDRTTMIQIGVFAHEFGHAFGLPDLYDTDDSNGASEGIGNWGLMGAGSWGGDNNSPESPSHMSAWEKEFLGWVRPVAVGADIRDASLHPVEQHPEVYRIGLNGNEYYLVEYRRQIGFDRSLTGSGLLVWKVNQTVVNAGLRNNRVNADQTNKGLALIEADGLGELDRGQNRGNFGDMFRGSVPQLLFDSTTRPASSKGALCEIGEAGDSNTFALYVSRSRCP